MVEVKLSDAQWKRIVSCFNGALRSRALRNEAGYRRFVEDVLRVVANDLGWNRLRPPAGSWRTSYGRFLRWSDTGLWDRIAFALDDAELATLLSFRLLESRNARMRFGQAKSDREA